MKKVRIILEGSGRHDIFDSAGRVHKHGDVVDISDADADLFVSIKCAIFIDGSSAIQAVADNKERAAASEIERVKARAESRMRVYDSFLPDARAAVQDGGDEIVENILAQQRGPMAPIGPITNATVDASFDAMIAGDDRDPYPKKKRKKR